MTNYITSDTELTAIANAIRNKASVTADLVYPNDFVSTINNITIYGGTEPTLTAATVTITPSASAQTTTVTPGTGYDGLSSVSVQVPAIASDYVGSSITRRDSTDLSLSSSTTYGVATAQVPAGYYADLATVTLAWPWKLIGSGTIATATTSTSAQTTGTTIQCGTEAYNKNKIIYVRVRDKDGKRTGHFWGTDSFFINYYAGNNSSTTLTYGARFVHRYTTSSTFATYTTGATTGYGIYPYSITSTGAVLFYQRYNSTYTLTIDGEYKVSIFSLDFPGTSYLPF